MAYFTLHQYHTFFIIRDLYYVLITTIASLPGASQVALVVKNPLPVLERHKGSRFDPGVGKILWKRAWQPTPVFLPGKFHEQRSLAGYSPWGCEESDTTEKLNSDKLNPASAPHQHPIPVRQI